MHIISSSANSSLEHNALLPVLTDNKCSAVAQMGDRLATIDMCQKLGLWPFLGGRKLGPYLTECGLGRGLTPYQVASWYIQPFDHNTLAEKWRLLSPLFGGAGFPSNTMWSRPRSASTPSFIPIHPTVWPQYTNVTDRQRGQTDNGPTA